MTHPKRAKILIVADPRAGTAETTGAPVRRYRIARLRFDGREAGPSSRFEHLKRVYD